MTLLELERRMVALEREVQALQGSSGGVVAKDWRRTVGMFSGDKMMKQIDEYARRFREADRLRARRKSTKRAKVKR